MTTIKTVALYARVSTLDKGQDPELQLREMREHCKAQGFTITGEYVDRGISGSKESRPQLNKLMESAKAKEFDAVMCWKIDRFGRSLKHLVNALADLDKWGVYFVALKDNLDLGSPTGRLMFHVISAMAQFERELTRERVCAGLRNAKAKGRVLGQPKRTDVDSAEIGRLRASGLSWRKIAQVTGIPRSTCVDACPSNLLEPSTSG